MRRLRLQYCVQFYSPDYNQVVINLDKVKRAITRTLPGLQRMSWREILGRVELYSWLRQVPFQIQFERNMDSLRRKSAKRR